MGRLRNSSAIVTLYSLTKILWNDGGTFKPNLFAKTFLESIGLNEYHLHRRVQNAQEVCRNEAKQEIKLFS